MVEVVTELFDRSWWRNYAANFAVRFRQETIHVPVLTIYMADEKM